MVPAKKHWFNRKSLFSDFPLWVLLVLYSAAALRVDSFHKLFHAEELTSLHSELQESNPCHKTIYHQQQKEGCAHQSHITENIKCPLCEFNIGSDKLFTALDEPQPLTNRSTFSLGFIRDVGIVIIFSHSGRSPPSAS